VLATFVLFVSMEPTTSDLALSWDAPPEGPTKDVVLARVRERRADRPFRRIEAEAVVEPSRDGAWQLRLWVKGDDGVAEREIEAQTCDALADAAATMLAVAATEERIVAPVPPVVVPAPAPMVSTEPAPVSAPVDVRAPERASSAATRSTPPRIPRPRARIAAFGGVDHGAVPSTGGTIGGEVGVHWTHVRVSAFGLHAITRRVSSGDAEARHWLGAGGLSICGVAPLAAFEVGGCGAIEAGALGSRGTRGRALDEQRTLWVAGSLGALGGWRFARRWSLFVRVDAVIPVLRHRFFVGDDLVGQIGPIGVRGLAGLAVVLP
jgi:hypothetical protein